ncbi:MAG: SDR family oxidoreductase [Bradymonadia bacterium]
MDSINSVVTGANSGIGLETARALAKRGDRVFLLCRSREKAVEAAQKIAVPGGIDPVIVIGDLSCFEDVERMAKEVLATTSTIEVLVNNAGGYFPERTLSPNGVEMNLALNHLAYFGLTHRLLPALNQNARVVNVASRAHRTADLRMDDLEFVKRRYRAFVAYGTSKLMNILFTRGFARRFPDGPRMNAVHPGVVKTGFGHDYPGIFSWLAKCASPFMVSPAKGAETSIFLATGRTVEGLTGGYYSDCKLTTPRKAAQDEEMANQLWSASEDLCGFEFGQY